ANGADLPNFTADVVNISRQSFRGLRAWRSWQCFRCTGWWPAAGVCRRRRCDLPWAVARDDAFLRAIDHVPDRQASGAAGPKGLRMSRLNLALLLLIGAVAALPLFGGAYA